MDDYLAWRGRQVVGREPEDRACRLAATWLLRGEQAQQFGLTHQTATLDTAGTILALTLVDREQAAPGTQVTVTWGEHPGPGTATDADLGFQKIRATVAPAPYDAYAATEYRRH